MRFGAFIAPFHRPDGDPGGAWRRDLALVELLEQLGYDEAWFGEHHSGGWETISSPELMIAAAAERTSRIRLGTGVISLPYHHPFMVAERVVMLDHMTGGRLLVGVGSGALEGDARMLGIDPAERADRLGESLDALLALLRAEGPVTRRGRGFTLERAALQVGPRTRPHPPVYVASSFSGTGVALAGRHGAGLLLLGLGRDAGPRFLAAERASGDLIDRSRLLLILNIHVGRSRAAALADIRALALAEQFEYWTGTLGVPAPDYPPAQHLDRMIERGLLIAGSPGECVDELRELTSGIGPVGGILVAARDWAAPTLMLEHWRLFASEVAPAFRSPIESLRALARDAGPRRLEPSAG